MKNRRIAITAFLLCACLLIGVGYAGLVDDLIVNSKVTLTAAGASDEFSEDVYFVSADGTNCSAALDHTDSTKDTVLVTINDVVSGMAMKDDTASVTLNIKNDSSEQVKVFVKVPATDITYGAGSPFEVAMVETDVVINAGGTGTVNVSIKLKSTITADYDADDAFKLVLTAETVI